MGFGLLPWRVSEPPSDDGVISAVSPGFSGRTDLPDCSMYRTYPSSAASIRRRPKTSPSRPPRRQESAEHKGVGGNRPLQVEGEKCSAVRIDGSATVTIVASRTTISCDAEITASATARCLETGSCGSGRPGDAGWTNLSALIPVCWTHGSTGQ